MTDNSQKDTLINVLKSRMVNRETLMKALIPVSVIILLSLMFPRGESIEVDFKVGSVWAGKDLIAPFSFSVYRDEREFSSDVEAARKKVYPVFDRDIFVEDEVKERTANLFDDLREGVGLWNKLRAAKRQGFAVTTDSTVFQLFAAKLPVQPTAMEWGILSRFAGRGTLNQFEQTIAGVALDVLHIGVLAQEKDTLAGRTVAVRRGPLEDLVPGVQLLTKIEAAQFVHSKLLANYGAQDSVVILAQRLAMHQVRPNIRFDHDATLQALQIAVDAIPRTIGFVQEDERIASKHERITSETKLKLESLRRARAERGMAEGSFLQEIGIVLHVSLIVTLYGIYLFLFRKQIYRSNRLLILIGLLILISGFFAYLTNVLNVAAPIEYLIFLPAASMLLTIIFDSRVAFYGTVIMAFLVAGIRGNDYTIALSSLIAGALAVYTVRDIRNRTQIFRSLGYIFLGYSVSIVALSLERFEPINTVATQLGFALVNGVVSSVLAFGLLIFIERFFHVTTDLTLIELGQFNHPLLRMLSERAPGTYHHSLTMASLAEAAAVAVGANDILARVGAYFHDIGKIEKPPYFVENQKGGRNKHDKLSPRMSSLIIGAHVKDGITLAKEYNVPEIVIDFIPQHHGTTRIEYFYNKAVKLAEGSEDETKIDEIKEQDYRYPGPKPQTKETGILMLADAIEASARALDDPSPPKLEYTIDELIKKRFEEGELDECPLTLKDLTKIKEAFLGVLVGIYHGRIKYPENEKEEKRRASRPPLQTEHSAVSKSEGEED